MRSYVIASFTGLIATFALAAPAFAQSAPPLTFNDPYFNGVTEYTSEMPWMQDGGSFSNASVVEYSGNPSVTCLGACTINRIRIMSREGIRVAGNGTVNVSNSVIDTTGQAGDHADGLQTYSPGSNGTVNVTNSTFVTHTDTTHTGIFVADSYIAHVVLNNVVFDGNGGAFGLRVHADGNADQHVSLTNVYFVGPFTNAPFYLLDVTQHVIIDHWENVRNATIVNGVLVPGSLIPCPASSCGSTGGDTTPPSTPANLSANAVSSSQINLSWTASTDNVGVTGYRIYRGGTLLTTVTGTSYSNTGLTASTAYSYYVQATDAAGNVSGNSNTASATTQAGTSVPTATLSANPTSITSGQSSTLTWSSTNATSCSAPALVQAAPPAVPPSRRPSPPPIPSSARAQAAARVRMRR